MVDDSGQFKVDYPIKCKLDIEMSPLASAWNPSLQDFFCSLRTGPSGFMGYVDLWGFILQNSFILNPFIGIYITHRLSINPHKSFHFYISWRFISTAGFP